MSYLAFFENEAIEIYIFNSLDWKVNSINSVWGGSILDYDYDIKYSYTINGTVYSDFFEENIFNTIIQGLNYTNLQIKAKVDVKPNKITYNPIFLDSISADGIKLCVQSVEMAENVPTFKNVVNANILRYHDDLTRVHELRRVLNYTMTKNMGFPVTYFRTESSGRNLTFKVYTLHNVVEHGEMMVVMNKENTPEDEISIDEFQLYYGGIKIYIDLTEWNSKFSAPPTPKDSVYIEYFNRRMTVSKVVGDVHFMDKFVAYEVSLIKYVDDATVNDSDVEHITEDFSNFIDGAGIMQSIGENKEYIEATRADSSIQDTELSLGTNSHNYHSSLTYRINEIGASRASILHNGIVGADWVYLSPDVTSSEIMLRYDVNKYNTDTFSLSFWVKFSVINDKYIYQTKVGEDISHLFMLNKEGGVTLQVFSGSNSIKYKTIPSKKIVVGEYYNFHINKTQSHITIFISSYDSELGLLNSIQEGVYVNRIDDNRIEELEFLCNEEQHELGMIKMNDSIVTKSGLQNHLFPIKHFDSILTDDSKIIQVNKRLLIRDNNDIYGLSDDYLGGC